MATEVLQVPIALYQDELDLKLSNGWEIEHKTHEYTELYHPGGVGNVWVHAAIFLFTFWWTFGILNMLYLMICRFGGASKIRMVPI